VARKVSNNVLRPKVVKEDDVVKEDVWEAVSSVGDVRSTSPSPKDRHSSVRKSGTAPRSAQRG